MVCTPGALRFRWKRSAPPSLDNVNNIRSQMRFEVEIGNVMGSLWTRERTARSDGTMSTT